MLTVAEQQLLLSAGQGPGTTGQLRSRYRNMHPVPEIWQVHLGTLTTHLVTKGYLQYSNPYQHDDGILELTKHGGDAVVEIKRGTYSRDLKLVV